MHLARFLAVASALSLAAACDPDPAPVDSGVPEDGGAGMDAGGDDDDAGGGGVDGGGGGVPNLSVDGDRAAASARVIWEYFDADDCVIMEGCVAAPGWRRLMRFETFTPNTGDADFDMGPPEDHPELFEYSACHDHYHYNDYADYRLLDGETEVGRGHKQAFCLMDSERISDAPGVRARPHFDCDNQGISMGWGDSYYPALDCQWVDVTDVAPGEYTLRITINGDRTIPEQTYVDNIVNVTVTVPDDATLDPLTPCDSELDGPRDCGWTDGGSFDCTPGAMLDIGCGGGCGLGSCGPDDDAILRICAGEEPCSSRDALGYGDDGCGMTYCPLTQFTCPAGGRYTVMTAPYLVGDTYTCTTAIRPAM